MRLSKNVVLSNDKVIKYKVNAYSYMCVTRQHMSLIIIIDALICEMCLVLFQCKLPITATCTKHTVRALYTNGANRMYECSIIHDITIM